MAPSATSGAPGAPILRTRMRSRGARKTRAISESNRDASPRQSVDYRPFHRHWKQLSRQLSARIGPIDELGMLHVCTMHRREAQRIDVAQVGRAAKPRLRRLLAASDLVTGKQEARNDREPEAQSQQQQRRGKCGLDSDAEHAEHGYTPGLEGAEAEWNRANCGRHRRRHEGGEGIQKSTGTANARNAAHKVSASNRKIVSCSEFVSARSSGRRSRSAGAAAADFSSAATPLRRLIHGGNVPSARRRNQRIVAGMPTATTENSAAAVSSTGLAR